MTGVPLRNRLAAVFTGTSLRARSVRTAGWTGGGFALAYALRLVSTLFLTRLLTPDAFGLASLAAVIMTGLALISDIGTTPSVIRSKRGDDPVFLQTAWSLQVARGTMITLGACVLAWPLALLYDAPQLFGLTAALAFTALIQGFASIGIPVARRQMDLRRLTMLDLTVQAATLIVTIAVAWVFRSVWALVAGGLFGALLHLALSHLMLGRFRHRFVLEKAAVAEILVFGRWILLGTLLTFLGGKGITAVRGTLVPTDILGMLVLAGTISWALGDLISKLLGNIAFPALSEIIRTRPADAPRVLRKIQLVLILGALPGFLLLAVVAQDLIALMYDPRYAPAGTFLMLTALAAAAGVLSMPYQNAMLAMGDSRLHAVVMGWGALLKIAGTVIGFQLGGVIWMIALQGFAGIAVLLVSSGIAHRRGIANLPLDVVAITIIVLAYAFVIPFAMSLS